MAFAALRLLAASVGALPLCALRPLGAALGWLCGSALRIRRALVEQAMGRAGVEDAPRAARAMYRRLGRGLLELLWLGGAREREALLSRVTFDPAAERAIDEALARGPVVVLATHTGNWELAAAGAARLLAARGRRLSVVGKPMGARGVEAFVSRLRGALGVHVIAPSGALAAAQRALEAGDVVAMPIDQVPDRAAHGVRVRFMGAAALVDRAPATVAWRAGATALVVASERRAEGHRVHVLGTFSPVDAGSGPAWIHATTTAATAKLEAFVRASPASWLWLHRRWRAPRERRGPTRAGRPDAGAPPPRGALVATREPS